MADIPTINLASSNVSEIADEITRVVDAVATALDGLTEEMVSNSFELGVHTLSASLGALAARLPESRDECSDMLRKWQSISDQNSGMGQHLVRDAAALQAAQATHLDIEHQSTPELSVEDVQQLMSVIRTALLDVRTALSEVSRDEIEEVCDVGLTVARMGISVAQRVVWKLAEAAKDPHQESRVIIEDVSSPRQGPSPPSEPAEAFGARRSGGAARVRMTAPGMRYLWRPLRPRVKAWMSNPRFSVPAVAVRRKASLLGVLLVAWPVSLLLAVLCGWFLVIGAPCLLLADELLQHIYNTRRAQIDDAIDAALQLGRLWYLTSRLAARRALRLARSQLRRALGGRTLGEAAEEWRREPVATAKVFLSTSWHLTCDAARHGAAGIMAVVRSMPPLEDCVAQARSLAQQVLQRVRP